MSTAQKLVGISISLAGGMTETGTRSISETLQRPTQKLCVSLTGEQGLGWTTRSHTQ